jgi:TM2 domain-containing membrane protein YozV
LPTKKNPAFALLLSCVVPGLGQMYNAERSKGLVLFLACASLGGLAVWLSGLNRLTFGMTVVVLWLSGIVDAYKTAASSGLMLDWYYRPAYVTTMLLLVGPLALPLLWRSSYFSRSARYVWTTIVVAGVLLLLAIPYLLSWLVRFIPELETTLRNAGIDL